MKKPLSVMLCVYTEKGQSGYFLCLHSLFISHFKTDALMLEVSKLLRFIACVKYCTMNKGSNTIYMSKVLKEVQNGLTHLCSYFFNIQPIFNPKKF